MIAAPRGVLFLVGPEHILKMGADRKVSKHADVGSLAGAVALGSDGSLLVGDGAGLHRVSADGKCTLLADDFGDIYGVAVDSAGTIHVADWERGCVRKRADGKWTTVADKLEYPSGLALDSAGRLYIKESGRQTDRNPRIRRLDRDGRLSLLAEIRLQR